MQLTPGAQPTGTGHSGSPGAERSAGILPATIPGQSGGAGNAFSIKISPDGAVIRNAVVEDTVPERYGLTELRVALKTWIAALERARRSTGPPAIP